MKFDKIIPSDKLKPYVRYLAISENTQESTYKVFPYAGLVLGFQYRGHLSILNNTQENQLSTAGITGMSDGFKVFKNATSTGTVLVYFNEIGFAQFSSCPAHELFNQSIALDNLFDKHKIEQLEEKLSLAITDQQRIKAVESFLISELKEKAVDHLIVQGVNLIYNSKGSIRINELSALLYISQSAFEKRFRKIVGTTPKKFASIVRFNTVLQELGKEKSLLDICYDNNFFDQAHFIKDFKQYTGHTPEDLKRLL